MVEFRRIIPEKDVLTDLQAGNYISFPKDEVFTNLRLVYAQITKKAYEKIKPIIPKRPEEWSYNKMLFILSDTCEEFDMVTGIYKHDDYHYIVTIFHSEEYINSL